MQGNEALGKLSPAKPHLTNCNGIQHFYRLG